jgi:hypothetical protein
MDRKELIELIGDDERIIEFANKVSTYANSDDNGVYSNTGKVHAAIVMGNIFNKTEKSIYAFAEDLNGTVTNNKYCRKYFDAVIDDENISMNYILRNDPYLTEDEEKLIVINKLLKRRKKLPEKTNLYLLKDEHKKVYSNNFTLADGKIYRYETDTENYIAKFSFNDTESSKLIKDIFDKLLKYTNKFPNN